MKVEKIDLNNSVSGTSVPSSASGVDRLNRVRLAELEEHRLRCQEQRHLQSRLVRKLAPVTTHLHAFSGKGDTTGMTPKMVQDVSREIVSMTV